MRPFGSSGVELSVLGHGAWVTGADTAGRAIDEAALTRAMQAALDLGFTWLDTAEIYATGRSEELVGQIVAPVRDRVFVVTKVAPAGAGSGMRPHELRRAIQGSLRRLATDHVDLYLLHWRDDSVPLEETWGAMVELVGAGLARFVGVSNFGREDIERCLSVGPVHALENQLSLLHPDEGIVGWARARGIAYFAYGALAFGLLSGRVTRNSRLDPSDWRGGAPARYESNYYDELFAQGKLERHHAFVEELRALATELGVSPSVLALRWVLGLPGVTAAAIGSLNPEHLRANAVAGQVRMAPSALTQVTDLVARHYGERISSEEAGWRTPSASTRE